MSAKQKDDSSSNEMRHGILDNGLKYGIDNIGLQYGIVYSYTENYMPMFKIVNSDGVLTENGRNTCLYGSLADLLKSEENEMIDEINKCIGDMLLVLFE